MGQSVSKKNKNEKKSFHNPQQTIKQTTKQQSTKQTIQRTISKSKIKDYVEAMLNDPNINIYGFPDAIERQLYTNMITLLLHVLNNALQNAEIHLFNHRIVFDVIPILENNENGPKMIITPSFGSNLSNPTPSNQ